MLQSLKEQVLDANLLLPKYGLVIFTWGNVSGIDRERGLIVIKPSGVEYDSLTAGHMAVVELDSGKQVDGTHAPSSDTATHLELYKAFPNVGGIVHTHSRWATIFAQAGMDIPALGTSHADYFHGDIPCTDEMEPGVISSGYEVNTGKAIIQAFAGKDADSIPAALLISHGPFVWGKSPSEAVRNAVVLEEIAFMAWHNLVLDPDIPNMQQELLDKHYLRKHGSGAYYGQLR